MRWKSRLRVVAVIAFEPSFLWMAGHGEVPSAQQLQAAAKTEAEKVVDVAVAARQERGLAVPPVHVIARSGPAGAVLETLSLDAALLVDGHRGRGVIASRTIGSVGLSCVLHSRLHHRGRAGPDPGPGARPRPQHTPSRSPGSGTSDPAATSRHRAAWGVVTASADTDPEEAPG